jgi:hypothetical protein
MTDLEDLINDLRSLPRKIIIINVIATVLFFAMWPVLAVIVMAVM